jgi:hypothetical protein
MIQIMKPKAAMACSSRQCAPVSTRRQVIFIFSSQKGLTEERTVRESTSCRKHAGLDTYCVSTNGEPKHPNESYRDTTHLKNDLGRQLALYGSKEAENSQISQSNLYSSEKLTKSLLSQRSTEGLRSPVQLIERLN